MSLELCSSVYMENRVLKALPYSIYDEINYFHWSYDKILDLDECLYEYEWNQEKYFYISVIPI